MTGPADPLRRERISFAWRNDVKDRTRVANMRSLLHDMRSDLIGVRMNTMPGARTASIERAREHMLQAQAALTEVMSGPLAGDRDDPDPSDPATRFIGIDIGARRDGSVLDSGRHTRAGEAGQ